MFLIPMIAAALIAFGIFILPMVSIDTPDIHIPNVQAKVIQQAKQHIQQVVEDCQSDNACQAFVYGIQNTGKEMKDLTVSQWQEVQQWQKSHRIEIKVSPIEEKNGTKSS